MAHINDLLRRATEALRYSDSEGRLFVDDLGALMQLRTAHVGNDEAKALIMQWENAVAALDALVRSPTSTEQKEAA